MEILSFHYHLKISFSSPIRGHRFTLRCVPSSDARQRILNRQFFVFPRQFVSESVDSYGNICVYGAESEPHSSFETDICGEAAVGMAECVPEENALRENIFRYQTPLTAADSAIAAAAREWTLPERNGVKQAEVLMEQLGSHMRYTPGVTTIDTTAAEAFAMGQGVCQDYAQIMLSLLREQGYKARYVVGMLMGEGKSHAWVEVEQGGQWYGFDPTNGIPVRDSHIKISHGRDYCDCIVNKGRFFGSAVQKQDISVIVQKKL